MKGFLFEIKKAGPYLKNRRLASIYFGGGTPSLFDPKNIEILLDNVQKEISFSPSLEITMEFNPESSSKEMFSSFRKAGINRASLGLQSFDDALLKTLTREHDGAKGRQSVMEAFESGIENITIDLMYEIPGQTLPSWHETLKTASALPVSHLSLYNLTFEEGTAFYRKKNALSLLLPSDEDAKEMLIDAIRMLEDKGFSQYEISAFAREGFYSRHNTGYWLGREFFGFGPSAFSYLQGRRLRNVENLKQYCDLCHQGKLPMDFEEELSSEGKLRELFTINLRLNAGVSTAEFEKRHGPLPKELVQSILELQQEDFLSKSPERIVLTDKGRLFFNEVASRLI